MEEREDLNYGLMLFVLGGLLVVALVYLRLKRLRLLQLGSKLPGPEGLPVIGNALQFTGGPTSIFKNFIGKSGEIADVVRLWLGPRLVVLLSHPADVEVILGSHVHLEKSPEQKLLQPWLGKSLLLSSGEKWLSDKKVVSPTFNMDVLKSFIPLFNRTSRAAVDNMKDQEGKSFDCHKYISEATVRMLIESTMGVEGSREDGADEYLAAVKELSDIVYQRQTKLWLRPHFLFKFSKYGKAQERLVNVMKSFTNKVLKIRKAELLKKERSFHSPDGNHSGKSTDEARDTMDNPGEEGSSTSLLDCFIESAQGGVILTDEEIRNLINTIMMKGYETTASACSFFLCALAARPDIESKLVAELVRIFGASDRDVTFEDTLEMKYMERCIMETLRLYPPVPVIARQLQQELTLVSTKATLPADCTVMVSTDRLHRRPELYPNPHHFDPDRFLPESSASRHYYSFVPFSAGPRSCIGRKYAMIKMKVLLSTILRNYRLVSGLKEESWKLQATSILTREDGYSIKIQPRNLITA